MLSMLQMLQMLWKRSHYNKVGIFWCWRNSDESPERVLVEESEVEEKDMQYLTIGIVVNAPYGVLVRGL